MAACGSTLGQTAVFVLNLVPRNRTHIVVAQCAGADSVDAEDELAGGIRAHHPGVSFHPVGGVILALLCGQQRDHRLQRKQTEIAPVRKGDFPAPQIKAIANAHGAGAIAANAFDHHLQIVQLELIARF